MSKQRSSSHRKIETSGNIFKSNALTVLNTSKKTVGVKTLRRHRSEDAFELSLNTALGKNRLNVTTLEKKEDLDDWAKSPECTHACSAFTQKCTSPSRKNSSAIAQRLSKFGMPHRSGEWIKMRDNDGYIYYYNNKTFESQWESPFGYQKIPLPWTLREKDGVRMYINSKTGQELQEARSATGDVYFYDHATGQSQWEKPWEKRVLINLARQRSNQDLHECKSDDENSKTDDTMRIAANRSSLKGGVGYSSSASTSALPSIHKPTTQYQCMK